MGAQSSAMAAMGASEPVTPLRRASMTPMLHATGDERRQRRIGITLVTLSTLCFAVIDVCAKWLVQSLPVAEVVWLRFATHVVLMAVLLGPTHGARLVRVASWRLQGLRALLMVPLCKARSSRSSTARCLTATAG